MKKTLWLLIIFFAVNYIASAQDGRMIFKGVPVINITMLDNKAESDINRDTKLNATMTVGNANGSTFTSSQLFTGNITIKGRGNSTWGFPKHPYNIVTCDATFKKKSVPLFGLPTGSGWTLLADYEDRTGLKTQFTSAISYALGLPWCTRGLKIELYINGEYRGLYTFCEKVERDANRVNIKDLKTTDTTGDALTGGYVAERQFSFQLQPGEAIFQDNDNGGWWWSYKIPDSDVVTEQQNNYMKNYWYSFADKLYNKPFNDTINGYRSVIYPLSFAQYFLLQDLSKNADAYVASWYITKDKLKKMDAGPGWDWGLTWGELNVLNLSEPNDMYLAYKCPYYNKMLQDTFFLNLVKTTFKNAQNKINQVVADAEVFYPQLVATGAVGRDSARWSTNVFDLSYHHILPTYQENVNYFFSFVKQRLYYHERTVYNISPAKPVHIDLP